MRVCMQKHGIRSLTINAGEPCAAVEDTVFGHGVTAAFQGHRRRHLMTPRRLDLFSVISPYSVTFVLPRILVTGLDSYYTNRVETLNFIPMGLAASSAVTFFSADSGRSEIRNWSNLVRNVEREERVRV